MCLTYSTGGEGTEASSLIKSASAYSLNNIDPIKKKTWSSQTCKTHAKFELEIGDAFSFPGYSP
jgi:hypothetical protein